MGNRRIFCKGGQAQNSPLPIKKPGKKAPYMVKKHKENKVLHMKKRAPYRKKQNVREA